MTLLDGKKVAKEIIEEEKAYLSKAQKEINFAIIWIGDDEASKIYVNNKIKKCEYVGIHTHLYHLDASVSEVDVLHLIDKLNADKNINGILLQSPVPSNIDIAKCFNQINFKKDIDGFSNISCGNLYLDKPYHISCTPKGIIRLLDYYHIDLMGKNVCIINRSNIVGKPLFHLLINRNATVTMCHSKTIDLDKHTKEADIVISAVGKPNFIISDMIKDNAIVVDVGISRVNGRVVGDVNFKDVSEKCSFISPTPGGVGPMTIAMVIENLINTIKEE